MILESLGVAACVGGINYLWKYQPRVEREIRKEWDEIMIHSGIQNKDSSEISKDKRLDTFEVIRYFKAEYGYMLQVYIPKGLRFSLLEDNKEIIENGLKGDVKFIHNKYSSTANIMVNNKPFDLNEHWKPVKCDSNKLYIGRDLFKNDIVINSDEYPDVLIAGSVGSGKSVCMFSLVTNLIYNHKDISLWLAQVSDKRDVQKFKDCIQTKYFAWNLDNAYHMFIYIRKIIKQRNDQLNKRGLNNISEYNKLNKDNKWDYQYIVIDEFSSFMVDDTKATDSFYNIKKKCSIELQHIIKESRSAGIFVITSLQRPDKENMPPIFKAMFNVKINFRQNNLASAKVVTDSPGDILNLPNRKALVEYTESFYIMTLKLDNGIIKEYIKDSIEKNHKYVDIAKNPFNINQNISKNKEKQANIKENLLDDIAVFVSESENKQNVSLIKPNNSRNNRNKQRRNAVKPNVKL